jgi:hypothetical protein
MAANVWVSTKFKCSERLKNAFILGNFSFFLLQTYWKSNYPAFITWELCSCRSSNFVLPNIRKIDLVLRWMFSSWTGLPKRALKVFWTGYVKYTWCLAFRRLCRSTTGASFIWRIYSDCDSKKYFWMHMMLLVYCWQSHW